MVHSTRTLTLAALLLSFTFPAASGDDHQPYAAIADRTISSLSEADIDELRRGGGWGLALPAELNGYPGPAHVLELRQELDLSDTQVATFEAIFAEMREEAILAGTNLIEAERALDEGFKRGELAAVQLRKLIETAERYRGDLRYIHLSRHLKSVDALSPHQVKRYNALRGYTDDPCARVPEGHDAEMWRKHNGCSR